MTVLFRLKHYLRYVSNKDHNVPAPVAYDATDTHDGRVGSRRLGDVENVVMAIDIENHETVGNMRHE